MIKASCAWGEHPDVIVTLEDEPFILYEDVNMEGWAHGSVKNGSFDLTAEQATKLAYDLLIAASTAEEIERSYEDYCSKFE